jgi:hypothetical protein
VRHFFRAHGGVELFAGKITELDRGGPERGVFLVGGLRDFGRLVVADFLVQRRDEHERVVEEMVDAFAVRLDADDAMLHERTASVAQQPDRVQVIEDHYRLEDVELEVALRAGEADGRVVAHHLHGDHCHGLALGGVDLARHDGGAGLVFRQREFAQAATRAAAEPAHVVGDFHERAGERLERAAGHDERVVRGERGKLVRRGDEGITGELRDLLRHALGEFGMSVESRADRAAAEREFREVGQDHRDALQVGVEQGDVTGKFLAEREWRGVHQVGAANLHDGDKFLRLRVKRLAQQAHGRHQPLGGFQRRGDRHGAGERVVGRLRHVHVIVRVHRLLRAERAAGQLDRAVGDDLVDVHVALRAAAGLPDAQREMIVEFSGGHLVGGLHDEVGYFRLHLAEVEVDQRARFFQDAKRVDDFQRHAVRADVEMDERPRGLRAVVAVVGHGNLSHAVGFKARVGGNVRQVDGVRHRTFTVAAVCDRRTSFPVSRRSLDE